VRAPTPASPVRAAPFALLVALSLLVTLVTLVPTPAPADASTRTPVMQRDRLTADDMVAWFRDHEPRTSSYRASVPVSELARLFIEEGRAEGVAGDIAFAQSVLETGWFRWPSHGQVTPTHNNFSGIGACDGGTCTVAQFRSARIGVRAQIQHLRAYADPTVTTSNLAHPLESPRFHLVNPKGRAPYWEQYGSGNWATDPAYGSKILTLYRSMLTYGSGTADLAAFSRFRDVPSSHVHHDAIERLAAAGTVNGCTTTTFCPGTGLTRGQLATLLVRALELPVTAGATSPFSDVSGPHADAIVAIAGAGIASGYGDGTFRPHDTVTRGQLAAFLQQAHGLPGSTPWFTDVSSTDPHRQAIGAVTVAGIATGFGDGTFRPGQPVTRAQAASMLDRSLR
jgi:hypothetical protein